MTLSCSPKRSVPITVSMWEHSWLPRTREYRTSRLPWLLCEAVWLQSGTPCRDSKLIRENPCQIRISL